jgi:hypothetical protein
MLLSVHVYRESKKDICVQINSKVIWLAKSQITIYPTSIKKSVFIDIPKWLAESKGIV